MLQYVFSTDNKKTTNVANAILVVFIHFSHMCVSLKQSTVIVQIILQYNRLSAARSQKSR